jgi:hypothetical protein
MAIAEHDFLNPKSQWFWWWRSETAFYKFDDKKFSIVPIDDPRLAKYTRFLTPNVRKRRATLWKQTEEIAAWRYEMARRCKRNWKTAAYPAADRLTRDLLRPAPSENRNIVFGEKGPSGDVSRWVTIPAMHIPPNLSYAEIMDRFEQKVKTASLQLGLERPKGPKGRNRPVSWHWVELLDEVDILNKNKLDDSERSTLSDARVAAKTHHAQFIKLLKEWEASEEAAANSD